jgi:hypothetical protein
MGGWLSVRVHECGSVSENVDGRWQAHCEYGVGSCEKQDKTKTGLCSVTAVRRGPVMGEQSGSASSQLIKSVTRKVNYMQVSLKVPTASHCGL